jgi:N-acetylneuraminic acid mutarotase
MMAGMKTEIANQNTKMANINKNHANTNTSIANIRTEIADVNRKMANIDTKMANTDTKLEKMNTKMTNTDTKLEKMNTKMTNLQVNVEAKFEAMNNEVREIKMSLNEVKDGFDHLKEAVLEKIENKERKQEEITRDVSGTASGGRENQHILVAGGLGTNSVEIFNYRQRLWSLLKPMPESRNSASSFLYNNHVTVAGGNCDGSVDNMIRMNIHPVPDLSINWSDFAAKLPAKMGGHRSVVYKDSLFVTGGYNADQDVYSDCIHKVQLKPPYTVKLVSRMPETRARHSTVQCDDSILIVGGRKSENCKDNLSSVLSYDIKKNECQQLPALPYPVSEMATVKWAENVVIIGGADKNGKVLNNVIIYNIKTGNSHMLPPMLHKRTRCMAVVIENTIVVLGGADGRGRILKSVESFNFERFSWEELPEMNEFRYLATAVVI